AGMAEHELKAEHQQRVDAADRQYAQIVRAGQEQGVSDQRRRAEEKREPYAVEEPSCQARGLLRSVKPGAERVRRRYLAGGRRRQGGARHTTIRLRPHRRRTRKRRPERAKSSSRR